LRGGRKKRKEGTFETVLYRKPGKRFTPTLTFSVSPSGGEGGKRGNLRPHLINLARARPLLLTACRKKRGGEGEWLPRSAAIAPSFFGGRRQGGEKKEGEFETSSDVDRAKNSEEARYYQTDLAASGEREGGGGKDRRPLLTLLRGALSRKFLYLPTKKKKRKKKKKGGKRRPSDRGTWRCPQKLIDAPHIGSPNGPDEKKKKEDDPPLLPSPLPPSSNKKGTGREDEIRRGVSLPFASQVPRHQRPGEKKKKGGRGRGGRATTFSRPSESQCPVFPRAKEKRKEKTRKRTNRTWSDNR